jgi:dTDP-4-amino-4,6-dideoxygalactose transaminase
MQALRARGIGSGVHYPALHLFKFYRAQGWREGMLAHTERLGRSLLTLPLFPAMSDTDPARVVSALVSVMGELS